MAHILIVDDSPPMVKNLKTILEKHGHQVSSTGDGQSGIEKAKAEKPDLVLMDVVMPGLNGFQAIKMMKSLPETRQIPVALMVTKGQETDRIWGERVGAKYILTKPVEETALMDVLQSCLTEKGG